MKSISALSTEKEKCLSLSTCDQSALLSFTLSQSHSLLPCTRLSCISLCSVCRESLLSFYFSSFNMELFLCLILPLRLLPFSLHPSLLSPAPVFKNLKKCRKDCLTSNTGFHFFILLLLSCKAGRALHFCEKALSIFLSFHLARGAFDVIVGCSAHVCT